MNTYLSVKWTAVKDGTGALLRYGITNILFFVVLALNVVHPLVHGLEGGSLDVVLHNLDAMLLHWNVFLPWHNDDHCEGH